MDKANKLDEAHRVEQAADRADPRVDPRPDQREDQRAAQRFDKMFPVWIESRIFGDCQGIARNISSGGMFVEMAEPLPLGSRIRIHFAIPEAEGELIASGEVKRHYFFQFSDATGPRTLTGMGVRFSGFEDDSRERFTGTLASFASRILH